MIRSARPLPCRVALALSAAAVAASPALPASAQDAPADRFDLRGEDIPIMPVREVRVGMKGYGLTVFQGTKIEPFAVEVVSVVPNYAPKRATIWIRCDHPTLAVSGPVQGMSGSPIFLWEEGQDGTIGEGGRMIGAFAYGYSQVKECLAGVQPIEYMRDVGVEVERNPDAQARGSAGSAVAALQTVRRLQQMATQRGVPQRERFRLDAVATLLQRMTGETATADNELPPAPQGYASSGVQRMMLPMSVGSAEVAEFAAPLLEPLGLLPVAAGGGGGALAGEPHPGIDVAGTELAPGGVLSIPLAFGDMDLSATGTVTDVRPDGTVLGFGHAMFGQGGVSLPMATGYVHFFVPRLSISFKQSGSLQLRGSVVQDQNAAVAGIGETRYELAPVKIDVDIAGRRESYSYQLVNHPQMTPMIAAMLIMQSMTSDQQLPIEHTLYLDGNLAFDGGRTLPIRTVGAGTGAEGAFFEILPAVTMLMNNPHENLELESLELSARVEPTLQVATMSNARLEKAEVAPGETVRMTVDVQPYGGSERSITAELKVPEGLPEGDYPLAVMDAASYTMQVLMARPHLTTSSDVDDMVDTLRRVMGVRRDAMYLVLQLPEQGIAVGRSEMPRLPSSRRAIIATPTTTAATPYTDAEVTVVPTDGVVQGQLGFTLAVRRPTGSQLQPVEKK